MYNTHPAACIKFHSKGKMIIFIETNLVSIVAEPATINL